MKKEHYIQAQLDLRSLAQIVDAIPLREFIQAIEHAETAGPIADPTLYRQGVGNMTRIKQLAQSLLPFKQAVEKLTPKGPAK